MEQVLTLRTNTRDYTTSDIYDEIRECKKLIESLGYPMGVRFYDVEISNKMTKALGSASYCGEGDYQIKISRLLLDNCDPDEVHNTIMHEVIHTVDGCMNHGWLWQRIAYDVNRHYQFSKLQRLSGNTEFGEAAKQAKRERASTIYKVTCDGCHKSWEFYRHTSKVKAIERNRATCRLCGSKSFTVTITENK